LRIVKITLKAQTSYGMDTFLFTKPPAGWETFFKTQSEQPYWKELNAFVDAEYKSHTVYPSREDIFHAFEAVRPENISCVLIGQDPYHGPQQAMGLSFSVKSKVSPPPSLRNIFKEYTSDLGYTQPLSGDLSPWAKNGVFLLNSVLTVRAAQAGSHAKKGWETFVFNALEYVVASNPNAGFLCFGAPAKKLAEKVLQNWPDHDRVIVTTVHPSPLSAYRGFFGSRPFTTFNNEQLKKGRDIVNWELPAAPQSTLF